MNKYVVKFNNEDALVLLAEVGEITYRAKVVNAVFFSTLESKETIQQIDGVLSVNTEGKGKLPFISSKL